MPVISKELFYEKLPSTVSCAELHYWNEDCVLAQLWNFQILLAALKFFLPIYIVKAVLNHKKLKSGKFLKRLLMEEIRSSLYGVLIAFPILAVNCILYRICGRINYYNVGIVSGLFSGLALLVETKENKMLDTLIFFNLLVESVFKNLDGFDILKLNNVRQTLTFMAVSSLLMHVMQNRQKNYRFTNLWFYTPELLEARPGDLCSHMDTCFDWILKGVGKYFLLGYGFSVMKKVMPKMLTLLRRPLQFLPILITKENARFGAFIGAYVGVYRFVICYILRTKRIDPKYGGAVAGLLAGSMYSLSPNMQVLSVGITTLLQTYFNSSLKHCSKNNKKIAQQLVYMVSHALLLHNLIMSKETCPSYYVNMINICTDNRFANIYDAIIGKYLLDSTT